MNLNNFQKSATVSLGPIDLRTKKSYNLTISVTFKPCERQVNVNGSKLEFPTEQVGAREAQPFFSFFFVLIFLQITWMLQGLQQRWRSGGLFAGSVRCRMLDVINSKVKT